MSDPARLNPPLGNTDHGWAQPSLTRRHLLAATAGMAVVAARGEAKAADSEPSLSVMLEELPPFSFRDAQGEPAGYAVELVREMLRRAELSPKFEFSSWQRVMAKARGDSAVLIPTIVRLPEREKAFYWLGPISKRHGMVYRRKARPDVNVSSVQDLRQYRTAVVMGDISEREMLSLGLDSEQHLDRSTDYGIALRRLFSDRVELLAISRVLAPAMLKQYGYNFADLEPVLKLRETASSMALNLASEPALRHKLQHAFDAMRRDGAMATTIARYPMLSLE
ncbi:substrate-binding periplasmic protein [Paucibacter sp. KCTC 42545]|uniref:substrate-binding periplasmic protein n=1 Tax=Paucibacter sp. KCTC 42545 TaxID=1768242 RepID=UPI000733BB6A|nr:transporter substrate-binding domain-containing protein [Paucibacter sp. KCTC 42545]ALT79240.1 hypothetical protein AT984_20635 [Paucibacter sp. KCTC 42545]